MSDLFPDHLPSLETVPLEPTVLPAAYRNAMPSLHMAWALVLWFNTRSLPLSVRTSFALIILATMLAALGRGEHYLIDLVVAFPLALAAQALCSLEWSGQARPTAVIGALLLGGWLLYLRADASLFERVGRLHWIPIVFTVLLTLWMASRVSRDVEAAVSRSP